MVEFATFSQSRHPPPFSTMKKVVTGKKEGVTKKKEGSTKKKEELGSLITGLCGWIVALLAVVVAVAVTYYLDKLDLKFTRSGHYISRSDVTPHLRFNVTCASLSVRSSLGERQ